ncbi:diguanylate cyclase [Nocardia inohanensis]|uniref:diguanylate cyclase n=1 Tax=Nocardia inohanensis TaxID=209246 RepID=UPI000A03D7A0
MLSRYRQFQAHQRHLWSQRRRSALKDLAEVLRAHSRPEDLVARTGGEEFAVVISGVSSAEVAVRAERLRSDIEAAAGSWTTALTVSIGVAATPEVAAEDLVAAADAALYAAKANGRNTIRVAPPDTGTYGSRPT